MGIRFRCPNGHKLNVKEFLAGKRGICPKCGVNLYIDRDFHGWYEECLQCAFMRDLTPVYERIKHTGVPAVGARAK